MLLEPAMKHAPRSEVSGGCLRGLMVIVHVMWTVNGADLTETTFLSDGHSACRFVGRKPAHECAEVLHELVAHSFRRYTHGVIPVVDLSAEPEVPVSFERSGDGVQIDHHLDGVAEAFLTGLRVDDDGFIVAPRDQVGPASERCRPALKRKGVLPLDVYIVAADHPVADALVDECGMVEQPFGLFGVGGLAGLGANVSTLCSRCFLLDRVPSSSVVARRWRGRERRLVPGRPSRR